MATSEVMTLKEKLLTIVISAGIAFAMFEVLMLATIGLTWLSQRF